MDILNLVRKNILALQPYSSARDEFDGQASIFLDANENPYPSDYNRYPDPHQRLLKKKIGEIKGVAPERIFIGNGSDEVIDLLLRAFCQPGIDEVLIPEPTYGMYGVSAAINNVHVKAVPLTADFDIDVDLTLCSVTPATKLIFLCSPNNPTGNLLSIERVTEIIDRFKGLVVIDEAYIDFTDSGGFIPGLGRYKNLVVMQTLSKAWGLAGLRLGMAFASMEVIAILNKIKPPYNIGGVTQKTALEKLSDLESKNQHVREIRSQRAALKSELESLKIVRAVFRSDANFLLVRIDQASNVYQLLLRNGIVVRDRSNVKLCGDCLRITVGTPEENSILIFELKKI